MPALPTIVTDYIDRVCTALAAPGGVAADDLLQPLAPLKALDVATILELFQDAVSASESVTATGGTTTTVSATGAFVAGELGGATVVFDGNATPTLAGVSAIVVSNTADTLTLQSTLAAAPVATDTFTVTTEAFLQPAIDRLRDDRGPASSPAGNAHGDSRLITDAFVTLIRRVGGTVSDNQVASGETTSGSTVQAIKVTLRGDSMRPDMFKNRRVTVAGLGTRKVLSNDEDTIYVQKAFASAPAAGVAVTLAVPADSSDASDQYSYVFARGNTPGDNVRIAELIKAAEEAVVAYTIPV